ncbi:MAG: hypothetical protein M3O46_00125, partial [Myxococcota bacterium]|nr:hypothetical protein [Myxococcota bacterium]
LLTPRSNTEVFHDARRWAAAAVAICFHAMPACKASGDHSAPSVSALEGSERVSSRSRTPAMVAPRGACFENWAPETIARGEQGPTDIVLNGQDIFWLARGGYRLRRLNIAANSLSTVTSDLSTVASDSELQDIKAVDARALFAVTGRDELVSLDLATGRWRRLAVGEVENPRFIFSSFALDRKYVYYAWHRIGPWPPPDTGDFGFSRLPREGSGAPEVLAAEPNAEFVADNDNVYWVAKGGGLVRRAFSPDSSNVVRVARRGRPLTVFGGRLFFLVEEGSFFSTLWSAAADGGDHLAEERMALIPVVAGFVTDAITDGKCLWWASAKQRPEASGLELTGPSVGRMRLADGQIEMLAVRRGASKMGAHLAADESHIYWADTAGGRVLRWER